MKGVKIILIAMEMALLIGLSLYMWHLLMRGAVELVEAIFIPVLALGAVTFQKEQQAIDWDEEE